MDYQTLFVWWTLGPFIAVAAIGLLGMTITVFGRWSFIPLIWIAGIIYLGIQVR